MGALLSCGSSPTYQPLEDLQPGHGGSPAKISAPTPRTAANQDSVCTGLSQAIEGGAKAVVDELNKPGTPRLVSCLSVQT